MNFIKIKKIFLLILSVPVFTLIVYLLISITNRPDIKNISIPDMTDLTFNLDKNFIEDQPKNPENIQAFDYKLIGYRYGESDSSVVVKKGNKEFVVAKGENCLLYTSPSPRDRG